MRLSIGTSRTDKQWKQVDWTWPQFIEEARRHTSVGTETHAEYMAMTKAKQDQLKDNGGFVAASLAQGRRKRGCCTSRCMITLDIDNAPAGATEALCETVKSLGCDYLIYSTRKHDSRHPRLRVILPLDRPASADEYQPLARAAAQVIDPDMQMLDPTTFEAERLMYWPSASSDSPKRTLYIFAEHRATREKDEVLARVLEPWKGKEIIADSAGNKSIATLRDLGYRGLRGCHKYSAHGGTSVTDGMKWLQSRTKIVIDPVRCPHTAREFSEYEYPIDKKTQEVQNTYIDADNHSIDMVRYAMEPVWQKRGAQNA